MGKIRRLVRWNVEPNTDMQSREGEENLWIIGIIQEPKMYRIIKDSFLQKLGHTENYNEIYDSAPLKNTKGLRAKAFSFTSTKADLDHKTKKQIWNGEDFEQDRYLRALSGRWFEEIYFPSLIRDYKSYLRKI